MYSVYDKGAGTVREGLLIISQQITWRTKYCL